MLVGSCFSQDIGRKLDEAGFQVNINPFGTLFNPVSIGTCLNYILRNKKFTAADFFEHNGLWRSYKLHSNFSSQHLDEALENINTSISLSHNFLFDTQVLVITLGSAWVYERIEPREIVANCHKVPQQQFVKRKLGVNEIISELTLVIQHIKAAFDNINVIFTISPVKHLRDGFVENNWSKSTLNIAVHELIRRFDFCDYYPAYEILNDDLRDYRFYKNDMVHPNDLAVQYVYEHFEASYFTPETAKIAGEFMQLSRSARHRVQKNTSIEYGKYLDDFKNRAYSLRAVNPGKIEQLLAGL